MNLENLTPEALAEALHAKIEELNSRYQDQLRDSQNSISEITITERKAKDAIRIAQLKRQLT